MELSELDNYMADRRNEGLTKLSADIVANGDEKFVVKLKEVYEIDNEGDADKLIEGATHNETCVGHDKKFKQGKVNKQGEEIRPDVFVVTLKYNLQ